MNNNNETEADIIREMREAAKSTDLFNGEEVGEPLIRGTKVAGWADRIEAAAKNAKGAWREERLRLQLAAASAEKAFNNADARRTLLERYYCEVFAERDRLRDLVRRLLPLAEIAEKYADADAEAIKGICALKGVDSSVVDAIRAANADLFRKARAAIGEGN